MANVLDDILQDEDIDLRNAAVKRMENFIKNGKILKINPKEMCMWLLHEGLVTKEQFSQI